MIGSLLILSAILVFGLITAGIPACRAFDIFEKVIRAPI